MKSLSFRIVTVAALMLIAVMAFAAPCPAIHPGVVQLLAPGNHAMLFGLGGMLVNQANLTALTQGFRANFNKGFNDAKNYYGQIATIVPSNTSKETYPWLGFMPGVREWIGEREIHKLGMYSYTIENKSYEMTISVDKNSIEDDQYGVYAPLMTNMGFETRVFPDVEIFNLLAAANATPCYDGQNMLDTNHPGYDKTGAAVDVSNYVAGAGNPWFLMDTRRPLRPLIYQERQPFEFTPLVKLTDPNVFLRKEFLYGVDGRLNVGFGFWQQLWGCTDTLSAANFQTGMQDMMGIRKRSGAPMGIKPNLLVCGPSNRADALTVVKAERAANGATNINRDAVDVLIVEYLP